MSNGRTETYLVDMQVKGRALLQSQALVAIILGIIVLGHEIGVSVLTSHTLGLPMTTAQILSLCAAFFTIIAGFATYGPSRFNASYHSLRRNFIISFILSLIACTLLSVVVGFFVPQFWNLWRTANMDPYAPGLIQFYDSTKTGNQHLDTSVRVNQSGPVSLSPYYLKVTAILKIVALLGEAILIGTTLICTILSIINAMRWRRIYQPAPTHDVSHGTRVYYDKGKR